MKINLGDYYIESDTRQYKVKDKRIELKQKDETVKYKTLGYFTNLKHALNFIANKTILDNDDINTVLYKLDTIESKIDNIRTVMEE